MKFKNKLISSKFQKRYKRFFVEVKNNGKTLISHCANSGSMLGLLNKDNKTWVSTSDNPDRNLKYTSLFLITLNKNKDKKLIN